MGLEMAEFLLALEDGLDIQIDDSSPFEPDTEVTVGMIVDYVEPKIRAKETAEVMAIDYPQKVFELTAAILAQYGEVHSEVIAPDTLLADLFADTTSWQRMWQMKDERIIEMKLALMDCSVNTESLIRKTRIALVCWGLSCVFLVPLLLSYLIGSRTIIIVATITYAILSGICLRYFYHNWLNNLFARPERFMPRDMTIGQFAELITAHHRQFLAPDGSPMTRSAIEQRVIEILAKTMRMKPNDIMLTDRLVQDLKMG